MQTFHLQNRVLNIDPAGQSITFPNTLIVDVKMGPAEAFGAGSNHSRLVVQGRNTNFLFDSNRGRVQALSNPPLEPLDITVKDSDDQFVQIKGDTFHFEGTCSDAVELENYLRTLSHLLPLFLNLGFSDPPVIIDIQGRVGEAKFRWEYAEARFMFRQTTLEELAGHVANSLSQISLVHPRLVAALHYFYIASRLSVAGNSPWEFMAEIILNLCKVLQILFGETMDLVRSGLSSIGYDTDRIEGDFIPLMVLRSYFNVSHAQSSIPSIEQLQILYQYLFSRENLFRDLLRLVVRKLEDGSFILPEKTDIDLNPEDQKKFNRLIDTIKERDKPSPDNPIDAWTIVFRRS